MLELSNKQRDDYKERYGVRNLLAEGFYTQACRLRRDMCSRALLLVVGGATLLVEVESNQSEAAGGLAKALSFLLEGFCQDALRAVLVHQIHGYHILNHTALQRGVHKQSAVLSQTLQFTSVPSKDNRSAS